MQKLQSFDDLDLDSPTEEWRNNEHFAANIGSILRPGTAVVTHVQMAWHPQGKSASSSCFSPRQMVLLCCLVLAAAQVPQSSLIYCMHGTPSSGCWSLQYLEPICCREVASAGNFLHSRRGMAGHCCGRPELPFKSEHIACFRCRCAAISPDLISTMLACATGQSSKDDRASMLNGTCRCSGIACCRSEGKRQARCQLPQTLQAPHSSSRLLQPLLLSSLPVQPLLARLQLLRPHTACQLAKEWSSHLLPGCLTDQQWQLWTCGAM